MVSVVLVVCFLALPEHVCAYRRDGDGVYYVGDISCGHGGTKERCNAKRKMFSAQSISQFKHPSVQAFDTQVRQSFVGKRSLE